MQTTPLRAALGSLVEIPRFFVWRLTWNAIHNKYEKEPHDGVSVIDAQRPEAWMSYEAACAKMEEMRAGGMQCTLGWMFTPACGWWFLDLDKCIDAAGQWSPLAVDWWHKLPGVFVEQSASGTGLHLIGKGLLPPHASRGRGALKGLAELYSQQRGIAFGLSGQAWGSADVQAPAILEIAATHFPPRVSGEGGEWIGPRADWRGPTDDAELIRRARASSSLAARAGARATFDQLWTNAPALDGFYGPEGRSERDAALASHLAFWTGCDAPRMERLMRASALWRPKWDQHRTYLRELTIENACAAQGDVLRDAPRVDVAAQMYGVSLPPLPAPVVAPAAASVGVVFAPLVTDEVRELVDKLIAEINGAQHWQDVHNKIIPMVAASGVPPALMPRLENAINDRLDVWQMKLPINKLRALINPPRASDPDDGAGVMARPDWAQHFVYVMANDAFFDTRDATNMSRTAFNAQFDRDMPIKGDGPNRHDSVQFMLQHWGTPIVFNTMYRPGCEPLFKHDGRQWANLYSPASVPPVTMASAATLSAIERFKWQLFCICGKRQWLYECMLYWMAHNVQRPGVKIRWLPLVKGVEGDGKSTISQVMAAALGPSNCLEVGPDVVCNSGGFTDWAHGRALLTLEEVYMVGKDRYRVHNMLKPFISNNTVAVNPKGAAPKKVVNTCNQIAYTNHSDAVPLERKGDRRWLVIFTPFTNREQVFAELGVNQAREHFDPIYDSLQSEPGAWRVWLLGVEIPATFDANGEAPHTDEKAIMADSGTDDAEMLVRDVVAEGGLGISEQVISTSCLAFAIRSRSITEGVELNKGTNLHHWIIRMGYMRVSKTVHWDGRNHRLWVKPEVNQNNDILRKLLDDTKNKGVRSDCYK